MDTNPSGIMPDNACKHPLLTDIKVLKQAEHLMTSRITLLNPQLAAPPLHGKKKINQTHFDDFCSFSCHCSTLPTKFPRHEMFAQTNVVRNGLFGETAFLHFFTQGMKLSVKNPLFSSASWRRWTMSSEVSRWQLGWDRAKSWRKVNFSTFPSHKTARIRCDWKSSASSFRELLIMIRFCCTDTSGILSFRGRALPVKDKDSAPKSPEFAADQL